MKPENFVRIRRGTRLGNREMEITVIIHHQHPKVVLTQKINSSN